MHTPIEYRVRSSKGVSKCQGFEVSIQEQLRQLAHLHADGWGSARNDNRDVRVGISGEGVWCICVVWIYVDECTTIKTATCRYGFQYLHGFKVPSVRPARTTTISLSPLPPAFHPPSTPPISTYLYNLNLPSSSLGPSLLEITQRPARISLAILLPALP